MTILLEIRGKKVHEAERCCTYNGLDKEKEKKRMLACISCNQIEFMVISETKYHCMEYHLHGMTLNEICLKSSTIHSCLSQEEYQIL